MIFAHELIPTWLNALALAVMTVSLLGASITAPWRALLAVQERQHVLFGGMLAMFGLWLLTVQIVEGIWIHLLGTTAMTLIVGWRFTVLGASIVLLAHLLYVGESIEAAPLAWLFSVFIPATLTRALAWLLRRFALKNLFVYMLGAGFGGGLLSVLLIAVLGLPMLLVMGQTDWATEAIRNWHFVFLVLFPEGFINGMLVTAFTVFYPDVVKTFDDDYYLGQ